MSDDYLKEMELLYQKTLQQSNKTGSSGVLCPHTFDTRDKKNVCILCDLCKDILTNRDKPKNDPLKEKARTVNAKKKYYSNILFMSNPTEVVILEYGEKIFNKLIAGQMDDLSEWKNFMHPTQGRNLYVTKTKVGPDKKDVDYNVEPRMSVSTIQDPSVLTRLYDITNITALLESGKVKPVYQSKFDFQKTEIRFLPSGDRTKPLLFYKLVLWHYNISKEEFEAVQAGKFNPITNTYTTQPTKSSVQYESPVIKSKEVTPEDLMKEWGFTQDDIKAPQLKTPNEIIEGEEDGFETETGVEPICFGQYDEKNATCIGRCTNDGWGEACEKIYKEKLDLRHRAKRLSK